MSKIRTIEYTFGPVKFDDSKKTMTTPEGEVISLTEPCLKCSEPNMGYREGRIEFTSSCRKCRVTCGVLHAKTT